MTELQPIYLLDICSLLNVVFSNILYCKGTQTFNKKKSVFDNFHVPVLNLEQPCICTYKVSTLEISFVIHPDSKSEIEKKPAALVDN